MVPSIICTWDGLNRHSVRVALIWACRYQPLLQPWLKWNIFLFVQPSVSLISNLFDPFFEYPRTSASLLSSAVIWCFLYIRHEFDTAIVAIFIKLFSRYFPYLFLRRRRKNYNNTTFFLLFYDCFFSQCCGIFHFGYCQVCCVTLSSRAFSIYVNGVKMHVQHSWKNLYLKGLNVI